MVYVAHGWVNFRIWLASHTRLLFTVPTDARTLAGGGATTAHSSGRATRHGVWAWD